MQLGQKYQKAVRDTKMDEGTSGGSEGEEQAVDDDLIRKFQRAPRVSRALDITVYHKHVEILALAPPPEASFPGLAS